GRAEDGPTEIPRRQRADVRPLVPEIAGDPHGYRAGPGKVPPEAWKDLAQRLEAPGQQAVRVPILGRTGARTGRCRQRVAPQNCAPSEIPGQDPARRQAADARANPHRPPTQESAHAAKFLDPSTEPALWRARIARRFHAAEILLRLKQRRETIATR